MAAVLLRSDQDSTRNTYASRVPGNEGQGTRWREVTHLTNSSLQIRKHAMSNLSACIGGIRECPPNFVRFTPMTSTTFEICDAVSSPRLHPTDANIVHVFLNATCVEVENTKKREKHFFVTELEFVSVISRNLEGREVTLRCDSSTIVERLSKGSSRHGSTKSR